MRMARVIIFKVERHQRKLMRKVTVHLFLATVLLGAVISKSHAATDASGNNATVTPPGDTTDTLGPEPGTASDTLPPEPGTISDTKVGTTGDSSQDAATKRLQAELEAKAAKAAQVKPDASKSIAAERSKFWGKYFGAKFGINNSSVSGTTNAPSASTFAYGVQGGYLQGGYNWDVYAIVVGIGTYFEWNNYVVHSNDVGYSSRAYGLDAKLGLPFDDWLPYIKFGYGRSMATSNANLNSVAQYRPNVAVGVEYNLAPRWSLIAEYKRAKFSNWDGSITLNNKVFTFGFNYYFDIPLPRITAQVYIQPDLPIPEPILDPNAVPEAPPPP
jgi:outer membrane immunogenic protein